MSKWLPNLGVGFCVRFRLWGCVIRCFFVGVFVCFVVFWHPAHMLRELQYSLLNVMSIHVNYYLRLSDKTVIDQLLYSSHDYCFQHDQACTQMIEDLGADLRWTELRIFRINDIIRGQPVKVCVKNDNF